MYMPSRVMYMPSRVMYMPSRVIVDHEYAGQKEQAKRTTTQGAILA